MPHQLPCPPGHQDLEPSSADPAVLRDLLAHASRDPWLASVQVRHLTTLRERLGELRAWLASLPRRMRRATTRRWATALPIGALLLALAAGQAQAAAITVDPGGSGCTLEDAITAANDDMATGSCPAGNGVDTIGFADPNGTYSYTSPLPVVTSAITIQGNGNTTIQRTGGLAFGVLRVTGGSLGLSNATISGGSAVAGGGIYASGTTLNLTSATISGNSANGYGGGILVYNSTVTLTNATISGNSAAAGGGGLGASESTVSLTSVSISGNSAGSYGGGILVLYSSLSLTNTTVSGNSAGEGGGGIAAVISEIGLIHTTITDNSATYGGGGISVGNFTTVAVQSTIVAGQAAGDDCAFDLTASIINSSGYNIESATSCGFTAPGDQQNVSAAQLNLGPLALNPPGTTQTHALGPGSFALNQIPPGTNGCGTMITTDQRGVTRPQEGACDVGAYEFQPAPTPTPTPVAPTAAQVTHFAAAPDPTGRIRITWETASEVDVVGFRVQRAPSAGGPWRAIGGIIPARGSAAGGAAYSATDAPGVGHFAYRLEVVSVGEGPQIFGPVEAVVRALRAFLPVGWR